MSSDNVQEMPEGWLQPFEKFPELTHFVLQMASSGMVPHGSGWTSFLYELNEVCKKASIEGEKGPRWDISITKEQAVVIKDTLEGVIKLAGRMGSKQPFEENLVLQYLNEKLEIPSTREGVNDLNK